MKRAVLGCETEGRRAVAASRAFEDRGSWEHDLRLEMADEVMCENELSDSSNSMFVLSGGTGLVFSALTMLSIDDPSEAWIQGRGWETFYLSSITLGLAVILSMSVWVLYEGIERAVYKDIGGRAFARVLRGRKGVADRVFQTADPEARIYSSLSLVRNQASAAAELAEAVGHAPPGSCPPLLHAVALRISRMHDKERVWEGMASLRAALGDEGAAALIDLFLSARAALDGGARRVEIDGATNEILHRAAAWADIDGREGTEGTVCLSGGPQG